MVGWSIRKCRGSVERIKAGGRAEAYFSQAASHLSVEGGGVQGKVEFAKALDTTGVVRRGGGNIGGRELLEKRRGTNASLYLVEGRAGI